MVTGCSDDAEEPQTVTTEEPITTETTPTTESVDDVEAAIIKSYEASWLDYLEAGDPPDPDAEILAEHSTGSALDASRTVLGGYLAEGIVLRGTYEFDAEAIDVSEDTARVADCGLDQSALLIEANGKVVEPFDDERDGLIAEMVLEDGTWKVASLKNAPEVCER